MQIIKKRRIDIIRKKYKAEVDAKERYESYARRAGV